MTRPLWSDPHPRDPVVPVVVILSTLGFAAVLGYEVTKAALALVDHFTRRNP